MKKFTFRLEVLVKTKEIEMDQLRKQLADQFSCLEVIAQRIALVEYDIGRFHDRLCLGLQDGMHSLTISHNQHCAEALRKELCVKVQEKTQVDGHIARIQEELRRVMGELKGLEHLREMQYDEYLFESRRSEETEIEEFIIGNRLLKR